MKVNTYINKIKCCLGGKMDDTIINDDFLDYVEYIMEYNDSHLKKIGDYNKYRKKYSMLTNELENEEKEGSSYNQLLECISNMELYENAFAYYLGMAHTINMYQLKKNNKI